MPPLETGNFISDLVETNPLGSDNVSQGDDHLRLIKHVLKTTFPNLDCAVTATCDDLNNAGKSGMPIVTTYKTAAAAQTHTLDASTSWVRIYCTGGGGGGDTANITSSGGGGAGTAIKVISVGDATTLTYTVGAGGALATNGENSTVTVNTSVDPLTITGEGGKNLAENDGGPTAAGINGDINIYGGSGHPYSDRGAATIGIGGPGIGGSTYWGGGYINDSFSTPDDAGAFGCGGRGRTSNQGASVGNTGVVVIEEY